jgi:hypothetical protein
MTDPTVSPGDPGTTADALDLAAGYSEVVDVEGVDDLGPDNPNVAACAGVDHEAFIGDPSADDGGVAEAGRALDAERGPA